VIAGLGQTHHTSSHGVGESDQIIDNFRSSIVEDHACDHHGRRHPSCCGVRVARSPSITASSRVQLTTAFPQLVHIAGRLQLGCEIFLQFRDGLEAVRGLLEALDFVDGGCQHRVFREINQSLWRQGLVAVFDKDQVLQEESYLTCISIATAPC
jgi:hypothetical protein